MKSALFKLIATLIVFLAALIALPSCATLGYRPNPYFEFHKTPVSNPNGLRTRYFCDVTDQTKDTPTPNRAIPLEHITIQDGYIKFQRSPNGQIYAIDREVARIDCLETLME